jgi:hypothetical protein
MHSFHIFAYVVHPHQFHPSWLCYPNNVSCIMIPHIMDHLLMKFPSAFFRESISRTYNTQVPCVFLNILLSCGENRLASTHLRLKEKSLLSADFNSKYSQAPWTSGRHLFYSKPKDAPRRCDVKHAFYVLQKAFLRKCWILLLDFLKKL